MKKNLLICNETETHVLTLYIYSKHDPFCWLSNVSKIIQPGEKELYEDGDTFKYELKAKVQTTKSVSVLVPVQKLTGDKHIVVSASDDGKSCRKTEQDLCSENRDKRMCIRRRNLRTQSSFGGNRDLYEVLKLDRKKIRKLSTEEQNRLIKKASDRQMQRWHPDNNPENADDNIAKEINFAYEVLHEPKRRADYNNAIDFEAGWFSISRWRAILWPQCETEEQKRIYRLRMIQLVMSAVSAVVGVLLISLTSGLAAPIVVRCATIGSALAGAGLQSGLRTVRRDHIENGCDWKTYGTSFGIGLVTGAAVGYAGVKITDAIAGLSDTAVTATPAQGAFIGASSGAVGGAAFSLANEFEIINVDGEEWTYKQVLARVMVETIIVGLCGGTTGVLTGKLTPLAAATETDALERNVVYTGARKVGMNLAKSLGINVSDNAVTSIGNSISGFFEERLNDTVENRQIETHLKDGMTHLVKSVTSTAVKSSVLSLASHAMYETNVKKRVMETLQENGMTPEEASNQYNSMTQHQQKMLREKARVQLDIENKADALRWSDLTKGRRIIHDSTKTEVNPEIEVNPETLVTEEESEVLEGRILFISEGNWKSEMIIKYQNESTLHTVLLRPCESFDIPCDASNITIQFKVLGFIGVKRDLKKWDRFNDQWYDEAHVFHYQTPQTRTFTIGGGLYYEKVLKITNEWYDETDEV